MSFVRDMDCNVLGIVDGRRTGTIGELSKFAIITDKEVVFPNRDKYA